MKRVVVCLVLLLAAGSARAAMMESYDLAGLVVKSDAIVVADRIGPTPAAPDRRGRYRVVRVVRGGLAPGAEVDVWDELYVTPEIDPRVVLFLTKRDDGWQLVSSGMRVTVHGKVFRFDQRSNPGGFELVPQGRDPVDQWLPGTPQLDAAGLDRAIADAIRRVDALPAALAERDPARRRAAVLALLPAASSGRAFQFYVDAFGNEAARGLARAGDLEGALLADARDHGAADLRDALATVGALIAYARDTAHPVALRVLALAACDHHGEDYFADPAAVRAVLALVADPDPGVRAAAVELGSRPAGVISSDRAEQKRLDALAVEARKTIEKQYAVETSRPVLFAIASLYRNVLHRALPSRRGAPPIAAAVHVEQASLEVDVICLDPHAHVSDARLSATRDGAPATIAAFNVSPYCADPSTGVGAAGPPPPPGHYELTLELVLDRRRVTMPVGSLVVAPSGEATLSP
ncbi:MAG TPA: hypothetical protein VLX92_22365 [Kofleriaceae bacterium]|nr:hypothetical protein [Kofleriaceae bacterium]